MDRPTPVRYFVAWPVMLLLFVGCSSKQFDTHPVRGKVTLRDGTPVKRGRVEFYEPGLDVTAYGNLKEDGSFVIGTESAADGAVAGEHRVVVVQFIMSSGAGVAPSESSPRGDHGVHIDPKYADYDASGLAVSVVAGEDNYVEIVVDRARR